MTDVQKFNFYHFLELVGIPLDTIIEYCQEYPFFGNEFKELEGIKERIERNKDNSDILLAHGFRWYSTPQGQEFWDSIDRLWREIWSEANCKDPAPPPRLATEAEATESSASGLDSPKGKMSRTSGGLGSPMSAEEDGIGDDVTCEEPDASEALEKQLSEDEEKEGLTQEYSPLGYKDDSD